MKKLFKISTLYLLFVFAILAFPITKSFSLEDSNENSEFARVINHETYLYADIELNNKICLLPKGYYLSIQETLPDSLNSVVDFLFVTYQNNEDGFIAIDGYVNKNDVIKTTVHAPLFPKIKLNCTKIGNSSLYSDYDKNSQEIVSILKGNEVLYYGSISSIVGETYHYVKYNSSFGYILSDDFSELTIPTHPEPLNDATTQNNGSSTSSSNSNLSADGMSDGVKIILIILICIPSVILVYILFKPEKKPKSESINNEQHPRPHANYHYFDDDDSE